MKEFSLKDIKIFKETDPTKWMPHFRRDWALIIILTSLLFLVFSFVHVSLYYKMIAGDIFLLQDTSVYNVNNIVSKKDLDFVLGIYEKKKTNFESVLNNPLPASMFSLQKGNSQTSTTTIKTPIPLNTHTKTNIIKPTLI